MIKIIVIACIITLNPTTTGTQIQTMTQISLNGSDGRCHMGNHHSSSSPPPGDQAVVPLISELTLSLFHSVPHPESPPPALAPPRPPPYYEVNIKGLLL